MGLNSARVDCKAGGMVGMHSNMSVRLVVKFDPVTKPYKQYNPLMPQRTSR